MPDVSEINTESRSEFSRSGQGVAVQFTNEKFHNKAWDREPRRLVEGDTRPKTGQKVDGLIETSSKGMNSRQSSKYYLNNPAALKRTRSISEKYKVLPAVPGSLPNSGEVTPLAQKPVVDQKKPSKSNWEARNNPTTEQSTTGKQNQPVVPTEPEVVVVPIKAENKLAEHVQPQVSIPIPLPNAKTDKQPKTSPFRLSITPTEHPKTETKGPVQVAPSQLSAKKVESHPLEGPRKTFSEKKISSTEGSQLAQKQGIVDSRIKGFIEKPQPEKAPEKTEELAIRKPTEQTFPRELGPDPVTEKPQQILHVEPVNPDPDRMSYKTGNDNDDLASYLQDLDSDKDSVQAWDNGESPLQNPSKISRFHPSNSPRKSDTKKKTADGIYAVRDSIAESQQRAPDHFNPESPPSTPESPPQPLASRQLARPVRLGLNPRTTVSLKDRPRQLMRYVFRKVVRMISEVSRLIEQQQKAFGPSISLTFKGPDGGAMTPGPATSPQESRKFDFSKQQSNLPLSQPMNFSSKPSTKLEFDIYQPKEFNVNPAFSQRSNTGREQGFLMAVQQLTKTSFVLGNSTNPDGKDFSNSQAKNEFARSRHVMSSTNVLPEGQQLVLNKVPSNGGNRSLTSSSAMKELSYDEYAAESYGAEPEDKHNNSLIISNRKMYERYYIGYFDFKQRVSSPSYTRLFADTC